MLKGVIFDMDGTLVDSRLDFAGIRRALGLGDDDRVLEAIARVEDPIERKRLQDILLHHERVGAECATIMPGVVELLADLNRRDIRSAVFTRNAREIADLTLSRLNLEFDLVVAREDAPPKPDPAGLHLICKHWNCLPAEVAYVGDYHFDLEAGARAGIRTLLYAPVTPDFPHEASEIFTHYSEFWRFFA